MTSLCARPPLACGSERLATLDRYDLRATGPNPLLEDIVLLARTLCAAPIALVSLVFEDRQEFMARSGIDRDATPIELSVCAHALGCTDLLVIPDLSQDPRTRGNPLVTSEPRLRFYAGAPLNTPAGHTLGTLCVIDLAARPDGLTGEQREGLAALGRQVMAHLEAHRRLIESERAQGPSATDV